MKCLIISKRLYGVRFGVIKKNECARASEARISTATRKNITGRCQSEEIHFIFNYTWRHGSFYQQLRDWQFLLTDK